jgi:hypothetical protein
MAEKVYVRGIIPDAAAEYFPRGPRPEGLGRSTPFLEFTSTKAAVKAANALAFILTGETGPAFTGSPVGKNQPRACWSHSLRLAHVEMYYGNCGITEDSATRMKE